MLNLLAALDQFSDVQRCILSGIPHMHHAAFIPTRIQLSLVLPGEATDFGLMSGNPLRAVLDLFIRNPCIIVPDCTTWSANRQCETVPSHRSNTGSMPLCHHLLSHEVPELNIAFGRAERHDSGLVLSSRINQVQRAVIVPDLAQLNDLLRIRQQVPVIHPVSPPKQHYVVF